eukprot:COSAG01_NODE_4656_length_4844_cov_5.023182_2_plen_119_part_00
MRLTMADTPMGADPVQNQPTPPSGACSPLPSPPASANIGGGDDAKLPPSGNTLMPDVPPTSSGEQPAARRADWWLPAHESPSPTFDSQQIALPSAEGCKRLHVGPNPAHPDRPVYPLR